MTPAHEIPPVCRCGLSPLTHMAPGELMIQYMRSARRHKPTARDQRALAQWCCPAQPGATRPASDCKEWGDYGDSWASRDIGPEHRRGWYYGRAAHRSRMGVDGIPRPLPGPEVPGW